MMKEKSKGPAVMVKTKTNASKGEEGTGMMTPTSIGQRKYTQGEPPINQQKLSGGQQDLMPMKFFSSFPLEQEKLAEFLGKKDFEREIVQDRREGLGVLSEESRKRWGNDLEGKAWVEEQMRRNKLDAVFQGQSTMDLSQMKDKQVQFIEPSQDEYIIRNLKEKGEVFIDKKFPANRASLNGPQPDPTDRPWNFFGWRKISQTLKKPRIVEGKIEPNDIRQGQLGDCYLLAALAALAERPDRIFKLFLFQEINDQKYFSVKVIHKGKWVRIDMDEYVPWWTNKISRGPAFASAKRDELWVVLLEKAWAKLYKSYLGIQGGISIEALHDFTGAPSFTFGVRKEDQDDLWSLLVLFAMNQYPVVISSNSSEKKWSQTRVYFNHAYTFLNAIDLKTETGYVRLVQLRNPHNQTRYNGEYSDGHHLWQKVSAEEKQRIGYNPKINDGVFFMPFSHFREVMSHVFVACVDDDASYVYKSYKDTKCQGAYFAVDIIKQDRYSFQVDKTPFRHYSKSAIKEFKLRIFQHPYGQISIGKIEGDSCRKIHEFKDQSYQLRTTTVQHLDLSPGRYIVYAKINYNPRLEESFDVNLSVYSKTVCSINLASREEAVLLSGTSAVNWKLEETLPKDPCDCSGLTATKEQKSVKQEEQPDLLNEENSTQKKVVESV